LGKAIKRHRLEKGLSQERLAELAGLDRTYISVLERGVKSPTVDTLERLREALGTLPEALLAEARRPQ
jgi:transcriptional regulator with XRE-family HTH domain